MTTANSLSSLIYTKDDLLPGINEQILYTLITTN